jgi:hypothetical protein
MQLVPVGLAVRCGPLAEVVKEIPDDLVRDEQAQ